MPNLPGIAFHDLCHVFIYPFELASCFVRKVLHISVNEVFDYLRFPVHPVRRTHNGTKFLKGLDMIAVSVVLNLSV